MAQPAGFPQLQAPKRHFLALPIDSDFPHCFNVLVHGNCFGLLEIPINHTKFNKHDPVRIFCLVFLPQEHQDNTKSFICLVISFEHVGLLILGPLYTFCYKAFSKLKNLGKCPDVAERHSRRYKNGIMTDLDLL